MKDFSMDEQRWITDFIGHCAKGLEFDFDANPYPSKDCAEYAAHELEKHIYQILNTGGDMNKH